MRKVVMISLYIVGALCASTSFGAQPTHKVKASTRFKNKLLFNVVEPFLGNCKFALAADTEGVLFGPLVFEWKRLTGTGEFEGDPPLDSADGKFARLVPKDFGENRVELKETTNSLARTDKPGFSGAISLTLKECLIGIDPPGDIPLLADATLFLKSVKLCPTVTSGQTFGWTIKNSAGTTVATASTQNINFGTNQLDTFSVVVQYGVIGKTCDSTPKNITVGQVDSVTWRDPDIIDPNPALTFRAKTTLRFAIDFSPSKTIIQDSIDLSVTAVGNPPSFFASRTENVAVGDANTKVFDVSVDNQTGDFVDIKVFITLAGLDARLPINIRVAAF